MPSLRPGSPGRRPSGARPSGQRTARRTATRAPQAPVARRGLTRRAVVLALVLGALLLSAAVPLRELLAQRGEIARLEAAQAQQRERVAALETRRAQLEDPAYVARVARERLHYVLPGETAYVVLRPEPTQAEREAALERQAAEQPWYSQLWGSVRAADGAAG